MGTFFSSLDVSWCTLDHFPAGSVQKYPKSAECETRWKLGSDDTEQKVFEVKGCATGRGILWYWEVFKGRCFSSSLVAFWNRIFWGVFESTRKVQCVTARDSKKCF